MKPIYLSSSATSLVASIIGVFVVTAALILLIVWRVLS